MRDNLELADDLIKVVMIEHSTIKSLTINGHLYENIHLSEADVQSSNVDSEGLTTSAKIKMTITV